MRKLGSITKWRGKLREDWIGAKWKNRGCRRITEKEVVKRIGATVMHWADPHMEERDARSMFQELKRGRCQSVTASSPSRDLLEVCYDKRNRSFWLCPW